MKSICSSFTPQKLLVSIAIPLLLLAGLYGGTVPAARAQEPLPPTPTPLVKKTLPPGFEAQSADLSITATADSYEEDNTVQQLEAGLLAGRDQLLADGVAQTHSISPLGDIDYVKFHLDSPASITLETTGPNPTLDDSEMWLYDSNLNQIDYNDDKNPVDWYSYIQRCNATGVPDTQLPAGDYYVKIDKRGGDAEIATYDITLKINSGCIPNTAVDISSSVSQNYWTHLGTTNAQSYTGVNAAPAQVSALDSVTPLIASIGVLQKKTANLEGYTEFVGLPGSRLTDRYLFPWYSGGAQICFGVAGSPATITVKIHGTKKGTYSLAANRARCVSYSGVNNGPVEVKSAASVPIIASINSKMKSGTGFASYTEFGGLSASDTPATDFMFPWYNNSSSYVSQFRIANVGTAPTTVTVWIGGVAQSPTYNLNPNQGTQTPVSFPNVNSGPVHVTSSGGVPITASMIIKMKNSPTYSSYTEFIGLSEAYLTETQFVFPRYNYSGNLVSSIRFTNLGATDTSVTVTIAGVTRQTFSLGVGQTLFYSKSALNAGPVVVQSAGGVPIIASMIVKVKKGTGTTSYSEYIGQLGLPVNQLTSSSWFPWYNNAADYVSQLRFAIP